MSYDVDRLDDLLGRVQILNDELHRKPQTEEEHLFQGSIMEITTRLRGVTVAITDALQLALLDDHFNEMREED